MTGTVTYEVLTWVIGIVAAAFASAAVVIGWAIAQLSKRDAAIAQLATHCDAEMDKLRGEVALKTESENGRAKMAEEAIAKVLAEHKLYAAEHFATRDDAAEGLQRVEDELHRMSDRIDKYHTTLLEALANRPAAPQARPRT